MKINHQNIEEYILDYIDGELNAEDKQLVEAFIVTYPEYQSMLATYQDTIMSISEVENAISFDKSVLYKSETPSSRKTFNIWKPAIAAALLIGICFPFINRQDQNSGSSLSISNMEDLKYQERIIPMPQPQTETLGNKKSDEKIAVVKKNKSIHQTIIGSEKSLSNIEELDYLWTNQENFLKIENKHITLNSPEYKAKIEDIIIEEKSKNDTYITLNLPIDDLKSEGIALTEKILKAKDLISNTAIVAKIGNKQIKIK